MTTSTKQYAYLGPQGTYTALALEQFVKPKQSTACSSVAEVFAAVFSGRVDAGLVPLENLIQGPVTETLDLLLQYQEQIRIADTFSMEIRHAIGSLPRAKGDAESSPVVYKRVYAHPQAIQQCLGYLRSHHPAAEFVYTQSNVASIELVKKSGDRQALIIAAESTLTEHGLLVLDTEIADHSPGASSLQNKTRFAVICKAQRVAEFVTHAAGAGSASVTSIVINPTRDRQGLLYELLKVISVEHNVNITSIHSRPDKRGGFVFYMDLEGSESTPTVSSCLAGLKHHIEEHTGSIAELMLVGSYHKAPFEQPLFQTIGIVGGKGAMGEWFGRFFRAAGYTVLIHDRETPLPLKEFVGGCQVILLSVPISAVAEVVSELAPLLRPGQLVVENCSIKQEGLPVMTAQAATGVEVLGIHTMFGESVTELAGQNIIVTRTASSGRLAEGFCNLFYKHGAILSSASEQEHDRASALVQSLLHLMLLSFAEVTRENFGSLEDLEPFNTPNSRAVFGAISRVVKQGDRLLSDLQLLNEANVKTRHRFLESFFQLMLALDQGNPELYLDAVKRCREFFGEPQ